MSGVYDWSTTAASNTALGALYTGPNMARGDTDNAFREVMAAVKQKSLDVVSIMDFIPDAQKAAIRAKTSTYDCASDFASALAAASHVIVPPGRYHIGSMVEVGLSNVGQKGIYLQQGADICRLSTQSTATTPLFWLKADGCSIIGSGFGSTIYTQNRCPDGIVLIGHRDMATSHANVYNCGLRDLWIYGSTNYGQTTGSPDVAVKLCNPQIASFVSYFHHVCGLRLQNANYGIWLCGWANANVIDRNEFWYIGNGSLPSDRAAIYINGAQENQITNWFFHYSPGSTAVKFKDYDNTGTAGGSSHVPVYNYIRGIAEQDPSPSGGIGLDAQDANTTGNVNFVHLGDNCPSNTIGTTFATVNDIVLSSSGHKLRKLHLPTLGNYANDAAAAAGGVAIGQLYRNASAVQVRVS